MPTRSSSPATTRRALCPSLEQASGRHQGRLVRLRRHLRRRPPVHQPGGHREIGTSEVDILAKEIGGSGEIAILSAAASATNQNAWIGVHEEGARRKYPKMKLVKTVYGNDDPATSLTVLQGLLSAYPNLKGIISPTTVGISAAAQYLVDAQERSRRSP